MERFNLAIAFGVFLVSLGAFVYQLWWVQQFLEKRKRMGILSLRTMLLLEQIETLKAAMKYKFSVDPYFFASYQRNVSRLEAALDDTFASGLINEFVTTRKDAPLLYGAFIQDLVSTETLPLTELDLKKWTKQHFYMGLIRTADSLIRQPRWYVSREVKDLLRKYITDDLINEAWNYLGKKREA